MKINIFTLTILTILTVLLITSEVIAIPMSRKNNDRVLSILIKKAISQQKTEILPRRYDFESPKTLIKLHDASDSMSNNANSNASITISLFRLYPFQTNYTPSNKISSNTQGLSQNKTMIIANPGDTSSTTIAQSFDPSLLSHSLFDGPSTTPYSAKVRTLNYLNYNVFS